MFAATVQGEKDSKNDGQHTRNAPLKSGPKLKDGGETRLDLLWSLPGGLQYLARTRPGRARKVTVSPELIPST